MPPNPTLFTVLFIIVLLVFIWSAYERFKLITLGRPVDRFTNLWARIRGMFLYAFAQKRVAKGAFGLNHVIIFWSFLILLIANGEFLLQGLFPPLSLALLPDPLHHVLLVAFDVVSLLTIIAVALAFGRRLFFPPPYLETQYMKARSVDALIILSFIGLLMIAYFGLHGAHIALGNEPAAAFMPVSALVAILLAPSAGHLQLIAAGFWWLHAVVLLLFLAYLPRSKHMHILTAIPNCFFRSLEQPNTQPREEFQKGNVYGVGKIDRFSWHDLFDSYSCTECGRCQAACPATATGKPLNPRQVVHDMKLNLLQNGPLLKKGEKEILPLIGQVCEGSVSEDTIWSCTTCGACMQACPVFIEQMQKIILMRRHLVQMESRFPAELLNLFENMEQRSNPWGIAPADRGKWASLMEVKEFVAGETEYLFYVGCAGSFDARYKQVTIANAQILNAAGLSWGILGREEKCCGDSLRRLGNEYVFDRMARENVAMFREKGIRKVIVQCPHCFSTLKNDYRQYGLDLEVIHHTELIHKLLAEGRLRLQSQLSDLKVTFHDPCYLGRHNGIYDQPRRAIAVATGNSPLEMERRRENSFCCGAGGGRMWMEESIGTRINIARVKEILGTRADTVCVACPYCMTMIEDGVKDEQAGQIRVKDVAELVAEAMR